MVGLVIASYLFAGLLFVVACIPSFRSDAAAIRARGLHPELARAVALAFALWPWFALHRTLNAPWSGQKFRPLWRHHRPDYDRIEQLEHEAGIDDAC